MNSKRNTVWSQTIDNDKFSQTDANFYKNKYKTINIASNIPNSTPEYKSLFKSYYKSKKINNNNKDSYNEINKYYLKCQNDVKNYINNDKNKLGLKLEGNKNLKNYSINSFKHIFNKACSARERILQHQILNYYYPNNNNEKLMGKNMKLTPIPNKRNSFLKNQKEKQDYMKAKRAAVFMRRLEYTHGLRKNRSQELEDDDYKNKNDKVDFLSVLKGAVLVIEDWWIKILNRKKDFVIDEMSYDDLMVMEGRGTTNSIEKNILKQLSYNMNNENSKNNNTFIENWLSSQSKRLIQKNNKNQNYNRFKYYNYKSLNIENEKKKVIKTPKYKKNKQNKLFYKTPKNSSEILFKEYYKSLDNDKKFRNRYTISIRRNENSSHSPIKIIQNSIMVPPMTKISTQTITPSSYLQNYFKDYCINNDINLISKACSHKKLKSFEFIENKYHKNRYKAGKSIQYPYSLREELLGNIQNEIVKYRSIDNIEDNINIGDEINNNINMNGNNIPKEILKYKSIDSNIPIDIINTINNDMNNIKIDNRIDEVIVDDDNKNRNEMDEEKNKKRQVLRGKNKRNNNIMKNNNNIDYGIDNDNDNDNNNIMSDYSDNITIVDNLLNNKNNDNKININNTINKKNSFNRNNIQKNDNFNKKDMGSDVEPIIQDNMNNIIDIDNDLNSNININKLNKQANRQYIIKYNIIKNLNGESKNNPMSERSSMDGSVDEIITKKLIEIHKKNKKYEERIKKAYNQVKTSKKFNERKSTFLNNMKVDCSDSIHNIEESDY